VRGPYRTEPHRARQIRVPHARRPLLRKTSERRTARPPNRTVWTGCSAWSR